MNYKGSFWNESSTFSSYCPTCEGGCGGNSGLLPLEDVRISGHPNDPGVVDYAREYVVGVTATDSMSGNVTSPWHAARLPGCGNTGGRNGVIRERVFDGEGWRKRPIEAATHSAARGVGVGVFAVDASLATIRAAGAGTCRSAVGTSVQRPHNEPP